jgi:hypothetical protein
VCLVAGAAQGAPLQAPSNDMPPGLLTDWNVLQEDNPAELFGIVEFAVGMEKPGTPPEDELEPPATALVAAGIVLSAIGLRRKIRRGEHRPNRRKVQSEFRMMA